MTTLATCWRITRRDGVVPGFTDHVRDLEADGITCKAASGYTRTAIRSTADLAVDNLDVESVLRDDGISKKDLRAGKYDSADLGRLPATLSPSSLSRHKLPGNRRDMCSSQLARSPGAADHPSPARPGS